MTGRAVVAQRDPTPRVAASESAAWVRLSLWRALLSDVDCPAVADMVATLRRDSYQGLSVLGAGLLGGNRLSEIAGAPVLGRLGHVAAVALRHADTVAALACPEMTDADDNHCAARVCTALSSDVTRKGSRRMVHSQGADIPVSMNLPQWFGPNRWPGLHARGSSQT